MTAKTIFDTDEYLYAVEVGDKKMRLTIKKVEDGAKFFCPQSNTDDEGYDIHFVETKKKLGITGSGIKQQLVAATETVVLSEMAGKVVELYTQASRKSASGRAIRITPQPIVVKKVDAETVLAIEGLIEQTGKSLDDTLKWCASQFGVKALADLPADGAERLRKMLKKALEKMGGEG